MAELIQIITTTDSDIEAFEIGKALIEARLAACVNIQGPIKSIYRWDGKLDKTMEWQCIIKTDASLFSEVEKFILSKHSYEIPEIIAVPILDANQSYQDWVEEELEG